jgi:hypothetical protein
MALSKRQCSDSKQSKPLFGNPVGVVVTRVVNGSGGWRFDWEKKSPLEREAILHQWRF